MKKRVFLVALLALLTSCDDPSKYSLASAIEDLKAATPETYESLKEDLPFNVEGEYANSVEHDGYFQILFTISYKSIRLEDVRFVIMPSFVNSSYTEENFPNVGYGDEQILNIDEESNGKDTRFGINIIFFSNKSDLEYKVRVSASNEIYRFTFDNFIALE